MGDASQLYQLHRMLEIFWVLVYLPHVPLPRRTILIFHQQNLLPIYTNEKSTSQGQECLSDFAKLEEGQISSVKT